MRLHKCCNRIFFMIVRYKGNIVQSCHGAILYVKTQNFASQQKRA